jgi:hypothetical protein
MIRLPLVLLLFSLALLLNSTLRADTQKDPPKADPKTQPQKDPPKADPKTEPQKDPPKADPKTEPPGETPKADPKEEPKPVPFTSKEGKFTVTLPGQPASKTSKVVTSAGEVEAYLFLVDRKTHAYLVSYNDYKAGTVDPDPEKVLSQVVEATAKNLKGQVNRDEKITLGAKKYPGRDVLIALPGKKGLYRGRVYLVGNRLYQVVVIGPEELVKNSAVDAYFGSFKLEE